MTLRRAIVIALERWCIRLDRSRCWVVWHTPIRRLACPRGMAHWSAQLDERWRTNVWTTTGGGDDQ